MKTEALLRTMLTVLVAALAVAAASWLMSERGEARAQTAGASSDWIMMDSSLRDGEGLIYLFHAKKEILLVYGYHRGHRGSRARKDSFEGDLEFLAGRLCRYDVAFSQQFPYPTKTREKVATPADIRKEYDRLMKKRDNRSR